MDRRGVTLIMPKETPKTGTLNQVWRREDNTSAIYTELQTIDIIWFNDHIAWESVSPQARTLPSQHSHRQQPCGEGSTDHDPDGSD